VSEVLIASQRASRERWFPTTPWATREERIVIEARAFEAFLREAVKTKDEHDPENPIKPLPLDELPYLIIHARLLVSERIYVVPKSRQMEITWVTLAYLCWRCLRFPYQKWAYVPQTKEDGEDHVEDRLKVSIWEHLPPWLTKDFKLAEVQGHFYLSHFKGKRWNSRVIAYPMGAGKLRGKTHSGIVYDEAAHQKDLQAKWKGSTATIQARKGFSGQVILLSSAERGSFFETICGPELVREAARIARGLRKVA